MVKKNCLFCNKRLECNESCVKSNVTRYKFCLCNKCFLIYIEGGNGFYLDRLFTPAIVANYQNCDVITFKNKKLLQRYYVLRRLNE